jgi:hypothetical protein
MLSGTGSGRFQVRSAPADAARADGRVAVGRETLRSRLQGRSASCQLRLAKKSNQSRSRDPAPAGHLAKSPHAGSDRPVIGFDAVFPDEPHQRVPKQK